MKLEELLNKLIEKGWRPFDVKWISEYFFESVPVGLYRLCWKKPDYDYNVYSKRDLVSKESGLWQFVCNNWMIPEDRKCHERVLDLTFWPNWPDVSAQMCSRNYEYWLMSSAICDEKYLEQFLIENIKVWNED